MKTSNGKFVEDRPVESFPIKFRWRIGDWFDLFEKQVELIQQDIERARAADRVIVYLSCPISSRGGGYFETNVDIANHTARRLMTDWGHRFWILNPCQYQMESNEGTGLIRRHARLLNLEKQRKIDINKLPDPSGGDYMRMWTRVLIEDDDQKKPLGRNFDAFYFLGPRDVRGFFTKGGAVTVTAGVEEYFARKFSMDSEFYKYFEGGNTKNPDWEKKRKDFFRFYAIRASANFSKGCHDEWNIWVTLNDLRIKRLGLGSQIAGYFDSKQIDPGASEIELSKGYAL